MYTSLDLIIAPSAAGKTTWSLANSSLYADMDNIVSDRVGWPAYDPANPWWLVPSTDRVMNYAMAVAIMSATPSGLTARVIGAFLEIDLLLALLGPLVQVRIAGVMPSWPDHRRNAQARAASGKNQPSDLALLRNARSMMSAVFELYGVQVFTSFDDAHAAIGGGGVEPMMRRGPVIPTSLMVRLEDRTWRAPEEFLGRDPPVRGVRIQVVGEWFNLYPQFGFLLRRVSSEHGGAWSLELGLFGDAGENSDRFTRQYVVDSTRGLLELDLPSSMSVDLFVVANALIEGSTGRLVKNASGSYVTQPQKANGPLRRRGLQLVLHPLTSVKESKGGVPITGMAKSVVLTFPGQNVGLVKLADEWYSVFDVPSRETRVRGLIRQNLARTERALVFVDEANLDEIARDWPTGGLAAGTYGVHRRFNGLAGLSADDDRVKFMTRDHLIVRHDAALTAMYLGSVL
jgi:hypothetical protein